MPKPEYRVSQHKKSQVQLRTDGDGNPTHFEGYAIVYYRADDPGTEYWIFDDLVERVRPGAAKRSVEAKDDALCTLNHKEDYLLGRVASGTCTLTEDDIGVKYSVPYDPKDPDHIRAAAKIQRGDLPGSSFGFIRPTATWSEGEKDGEYFEVRELTDFEITDVGPQTDPAYTSTTATARSGMTRREKSEAENYRKELEAEKRSASGEETSYSPITEISIIEIEEQEARYLEEHS